ncbi:DUF4133 domain-containing protein [Myroides sp. LJL119]
MKKYRILKGVGKPLEFYGLKGAYIFYFLGGLIGNLLLIVVMHLVGFPPLLYFFTASVLGGFIL